MPSQPSDQLKAAIAANLRAAAKAKGFTQRQVADSVGATPAQVSKWMAGDYEPSLMYRFKLADLLTDGDISALYYQEEKAA